MGNFLPVFLYMWEEKHILKLCSFQYHGWNVDVIADMYDADYVAEVTWHWEN